MKRNISIFIASLAWITVLLQYYLMIQNRVASITETTVRFFSFFTILTNSLVAIFFTLTITRPKKGACFPILNKPGTLTALTTYITIVGLVYQVLLRKTWAPTGLQKIVDEALHAIIPIMVIIFWYLYEDKTLVKFRQIPRWLIYPLLYLIFILIRGRFSGFYPYPFVNVTNIGLPEVLVNCAMIAASFIIISAIFIKTGKLIKRQ